MFTVLTDDQQFASGAKAWLAETDYRLAGSVEEFRDYAHEGLKINPTPALDFEATGLNVWTDKIVGLSVSFEKGKGMYAPVRHFTAPELNLPIPGIRQVLTEIDQGSADHWWYNNDFDHQIAWYDWGWKPSPGKGDVSIPKGRDAMIGVYLEYSDADSHALKDTVERIFGVEMLTYEDILGFKRKKKTDLLPGFQHVHPNDAPPYACADADWTGRLGRLSIIVNAIKAQRFIWNLEHKILPPIREGIEHGIPMDVPYLSMLTTQVRTELAGLEATIRQELGVPADFNLRSRPQLAVRLEAMDVPIKERTKAGHLSTRKGLLEEHAGRFPVCASLVRYAELGAAERNLLRKILHACAHFGPRIRIPFNPIGAPTGRMSSGGAGRTTEQAYAKGYAPLNGQAFSDAEKKPYLPDVRAGVSVAPFQTDEWVIVAMDYVQVELVVLTNVSGEQQWIEAFRRGVDFHSNTYSIAKGIPVEQVGKPQRKKGKTLSFAIVYQAAPPTVAKQAGISEQEADQLIKAVLARCPRLNQWVKATKAFASSHGFVQTYFGRRRMLRGYFAEDGDYSTKQARMLRGQGEREGVNAPIQGGAADVLKIAVYKVWKALREWQATKDWIPIMWVHDEIVSLVRRSRLYELLPKVQAEMEFPVKGWVVPLKVDPEVGWNWGLSGKGEKPPPGEPSKPAGRHWHGGLVSWAEWQQRFPPETANQPVLCWLPESYYAAAPTVPEPPDEELDDLDDLLSGD